MISKHLHILCLLAAGVFLFIFQAKNTGFETGHLGWVSSHVLAQSEKATTENGFLGFALEEISTEGHRDKVYFDRYPIFFSAFSRIFRHSFGETLASQIVAARTLMNIIFLLTLIITFFIAQLLTDNARALSATLLTFSGSTLLYYKEMFHFDQPALLGQSLLFLSIGRHLTKGSSSKWIYLTTILAVSMGRGYSSMFILLLWALFSIYKTVSDKKPLATLINHVSFKAGFIGLLVCLLSLSYNVYTESVVRNVPIDQTSIIHSAKARTGVTTVADLEDRVSIVKVANKLFNRGLYGLIPFALKPTVPQSNNLMGWVAILALVIWLIYAIKMNRSTLVIPKEFRILLLFSGIFWLVFMKRLFVFHDYTIMYLVFFNLVTFVYLLNSIPANFIKWSSLITLFVFAGSLSLAQHQLDLSRSMTEPITEDMSRIRLILNSESEKVISLDEPRSTFLKGLPYALGYYLPDQTLAPKGYSQLVLTKNIQFLGRNLTPNNNVVFLFDSTTEKP